MKDTRRTRMVLGALLILAFALITVDAKGGAGSPLSGLRRAGADMFGPVERLTSAVVRPVGDFFGGWGHSSSDRNKITNLQAEVASLQAQLKTSPYASNENAELTKLGQYASVGQLKLRPARVIAIGAAQDFSWTVTIDVGSDDGVKAGMTVISADGLVGRTTTVSPMTTTVLLACDPESSVGVRLTNSMQVGVAQGGGTKPMTVQLMSGQAKMAVGDTLVTFGSQSGTPFVAGIPVGSITAVRNTPGALTRTATVKPFVDFTSLDLVAVVLTPPNSDPGDNLVPIVVPTPAGTPTTPAAGAPGAKAKAASTPAGAPPNPGGHG
jgi:rod shape-determining protein MreC